ncbi:hypothetical protein PUNSTDRAFT_133054 [Punctularia strigosozonata HHB-11173 SS5]|uniref:uncharacterized protein n=1 Tax=Punctularia strigosozonata (strain HHB-11173) TaxID=741275 RepID=UPI00044169BC|nr:uncharacterized protein PUNSTDRAFT_133054 [Punctularia strigosozonata HHB-11173 SS5]EIN10993.1 hypothetical protein PUNSTDRAFT_133054 [Punctularia strigosozonata HHB-11173 SS5]
MGKWTLEYHDDVFTHKMKTLVAGACKRLSLEKGEPVISYETLVEDLDTSDAFTATMIEVLVKELADRRERRSRADHRLIAERTATTLRALGSPHCIHRPSGHLRHSHLSTGGLLTEYLTDPPEEMGMDDEDEGEDFGSILDGATNTTSALYDAMSQEPSRSTGPPRSGSASTRSNLHPSLPRPRSTWALGSSRSLSTSLTRQTSLRRNSRNRPFEFEAHSLQRRHESREFEAERNHLSEPSNSDRSSYASRTRLSPAGRPSPFSRSQRSEEVNTSDDPPSMRTTALHDAEIQSGTGHEASSSRPSLYQQSLPSIHTMLTRPANLSSGSSAPRLRRGGLRAPESLATSLPPRRSFETQWSESTAELPVHETPSTSVTNASQTAPDTHYALVTPPADF